MKLLKEFKEFALKGNMMDLAVGVIIGGAFQGLISSLVDNIIMPIVSIFTGGVDFSEWAIRIPSWIGSGNGTTIKFGLFFAQIIDFVIMAFVIFLMVQFMNRLRRPKDAPATVKECPYCKSEIDINAVKCPNCTSDL